MQKEEDLKVRSRDIAWPKGFDPEKADMFAHNEIQMDVSAESVWKVLVDVQSWPEWYPNAPRVRVIDGLVSGALGMGTIFEFTTFGGNYRCSVIEFTPNTRIGWLAGPAGAEPTNYHAWLIKDEGNHCFVETEEMGKGETIQKVMRADEGLFHRGHDLWLSSLRFASKGLPK